MEQFGVWGQLGFGGALVAVLVFLILSFSKGWIIPASSHNRELALEQKRADEWKAVAGERQATIASLTIQNTAMLEATKTTMSVVQALPVPNKGGD